jgi:hypothetical protein
MAEQASLPEKDALLDVIGHLIAVHRTLLAVKTCDRVD